MSKTKKNRNKTKHKPKAQRLVPTAPNIVSMQPKAPLGAYLDEEATKEKMAEINEDIQELMKKHHIFNGIFGCLLPVVAWRDAPTAEDPNKKGWRIQNVMAVRVSSSTMKQDETVFLGILNQAAGRLYGPPPAAPAPAPAPQP